MSFSMNISVGQFFSPPGDHQAGARNVRLHPQERRASSNSLLGAVGASVPPVAAQETAQGFTLCSVSANHVRSLAMCGLIQSS